MTPSQQRAAAEKFVAQWVGHGDERPEMQQFWMQLSTEVLGVPDPFAFDSYSAEHKDAKGGFADIMLPKLGVLVEQKGQNIDLDKPEKRQGRMVTPVEQALSYNNSFPPSQRQSVICTCNFRQFRFYDLENDPLLKGAPYAEFTLEQLPDNLHVFRALMRDDASEARVVESRRVDVEAARRVAVLHEGLSRFYHDPDDPAEHRALALTTVRLVFLYYGEDSGLLKPHQFTDYVETLSPDWVGVGLQSLFDWVDTPPKEQDRKYASPTVKEFPYIDGGLFHDDVPVPTVDADFRQALLDMGRDFDWSDISPVVFGSLMEETLSHDQRRKGGMHYTSPKNIHRLIDPLFLDDLKTELKALTDQYDDPSISPQKRGALIRQLKAYQDKLASLQFFDPACGSGNFLTETFLCLRELEDQALLRILKGETTLNLGDEYTPVKVNIRQMHGIEINDFACSVARTALWIAEQQALDRTEVLCDTSYGRLPLADSGDILCANALQVDWNTLLPGNQCNYVLGNPPFAGRGVKTDQQIEETKTTWGKWYDGNLDYVTCWFHKTADYLANNPTAEFAFVATNSVSQGLQVPAMASYLKSQNWRIRFAHRSFRWDAQTTDNANVHVVIIGMSQHPQERTLVIHRDNDTEQCSVTNINGYLIDSPDVIITRRMKPLSPLLNDVVYGSKPADDGNLILDDKEQYQQAMADPIAAKYVRRYVGAKELINKIDRWCLWLVDATPSDLRHSLFLRERVEANKAFRLASKASSTRDWANRAWLFKQNGQPSDNYLCIPCHFSGGREYMTTDWLPADVIVSNAAMSVIDPDGFNFAIIESAMFMTWQDTVGGRLKSDCRFANTITWNNLPLPQLDTETHQKVVEAGQNVLKARKNHPGQSLADLYAPDFMPADLRKAHQALDQIVDVAFGSGKPCGTEEERLQVLFTRYAEMAAK